jgi:hypothetical protein
VVFLDDSETTRSAVLLKEAAPNAKNSLNAAGTGGSAVLDDRTRAFLCDRAALIVGFVGPDGRPRATRGWGMEITDGDGEAEPDRCRILLEQCQVRHLEHLVPGGLLAVTGADVVSLRSIGLKGPVEAIEAIDEHDLEHHRRHCDAFFDDIEATDHTPRRLLDRFRPGSLVACTFRAEQVFDQSPGPAAGRSIGPATADGGDRS